MAEKHLEEEEVLRPAQETAEAEHHHHHHHDHDEVECHDPNCTDPSHHHHHHHDHDDDECHDPNCTDPSHHHHHHHDHDDDECHDPNCTDPSHHHHHHDDHDHHHHDESEREEVIDEALILSRSRSFACAPALTPQALRARAERCFLRLGEKLGVDGIILGHIKGVLEAGDGSLSLSVTRVGTVDVTELGRWDALGRVENYTMTVNIMSLVAPSIYEDDLFYGMDRA